MTCDTWHVSCDTWHVTHDTWHMACDMLWGVNILTKFQLPSFYGLWFIISWRFGGKGLRTKWMNEWIHDGGDCRTAPATPGLLISFLAWRKKNGTLPRKTLKYNGKSIFDFVKYRPKSSNKIWNTNYLVIYEKKGFQIKFWTSGSAPTGKCIKAKV